MNDLLDLARRQSFRARRESSYDRSGGNGDAWVFEPHQTRVIADIKSPGIIRHIWTTITPEDRYYLRKVVIRMYWDGEEEPSVLCPVGDFFGLGHSMSFTYSCAAFTTSNNYPAGRAGDGVAMNCWLPMPFARSARIEIDNQLDKPIEAYFYVDWQQYDSLPGELMSFHASWRRENPCERPPDDGSKEYADMLRRRNLTDRYNYTILEATGRGNYIGMNMSVDNRAQTWWGEGDDMIFIDRPEGGPGFGGDWPPDLHGTGSEDYLCQAWGMQKTHSLYCGEPWCEHAEGSHTHHIEGKVCVYRYHIQDPIPFESSIRVSIEHGHANDQQNDYASVAYWYQTEPHAPFPPLPPPQNRIPNE